MANKSAKPNQPTDARISPLRQRMSPGTQLHHDPSLWHSGVSDEPWAAVSAAGCSAMLVKGPDDTQSPCDTLCPLLEGAT